MHILRKGLFSKKVDRIGKNKGISGNKKRDSHMKVSFLLFVSIYNPAFYPPLLREQIIPHISVWITLS